MLGQQSAQHCQTPGRADAQSQSEPATRRRPIPSHFSVYLDLLRLAMAVDVVLFHLRTIGVGPLSIQHLLPGTGHECVIVFFVLSGYIIAATAERKDSTLLDYALDRFARVYSVAIPALLISTAASLALGVGSHADVLAALAANLTFVGESWSANAFPPTDPPFWSLCYEVMYYTLFGCAVYLRGIARVAALTLVVLLAGPLRYSLPGLALSLVLLATAVYVVGTLTELRRHRVRAWMTAIVGSVVRWRRRRLGERGARG